MILAFGLIRPYKGTDVLLEAFQPGRAAPSSGSSACRGCRWTSCASSPRGRPGRVRFVDRFVTDPEIPAYMRRADLVVLPYRNIEQSGVLYTALAFGRPLVLSDVGGFPEVAEPRAPRGWCRPGIPRRWRRRCASCSADPAAARAPRRRAPSSRAAGRYSWDEIGRRTVTCTAL